MKRAVASLLVVMGCRFDLPDVVTDASGDVGTEGAINCTPWNTRGGHVQGVCTTSPEPRWQVSANVTYDTDTGMAIDGASPRSFTLLQGPYPRLRVISVEDFEVAQGATLRVIGASPLLVLSHSNILVAGTIDVSSKTGESKPGAGGSRASCTAAGNGQGTSEAGGGGGAGLGIGGMNGGIGDQNNAMNAGGTASSSVNRVGRTIFGGCRGGNGGGGTAGGRGGEGGGALQLTSKVGITIAATGTIHAGGMGGRGASGNGGGGGGGSGGVIGLDAPMVTTMAGSMLAANGGAGGIGCRDNTSGIGAPGEDGRPINRIARTGSATSCTDGALGGDGGAQVDPLPAAPATPPPASTASIAAAVAAAVAATSSSGRRQAAIR
jgi:hypothetical protein